MKEEYTEKIYATYNKEYGKWNEFDATANLDEVDDDFVEYTRTDLVPKWHKYPAEKPLKSGKYICQIQVQHENGKIFYQDVDWHKEMVSSWWICNFDWDILMWQELPEPFKED